MNIQFKKIGHALANGIFLVLGVLFLYDIVKFGSTLYGYTNGLFGAIRFAFEGVLCILVFIELPICIWDCLKTRYGIVAILVAGTAIFFLGGYFGFYLGTYIRWGLVNTHGWAAFVCVIVISITIGAIHLPNTTGGG